MENTDDFDLKQVLLYDGPFGPKEAEQIVRAISGTDTKPFDTLREAIGELEVQESRNELSPAGRVRFGVALYLAGSYPSAVERLKKGDSGALSLYYLAKTFFALREYDEAVKHYDLSAKAGYSKDACTLGKAEIYRYKGDAQKSLDELDKLSGAVEQTAEYLYQRGAAVSQLVGTDLEYNPNEAAVTLFERAVAADKNHPAALFGLAMESERRGNDEEALELYKSAVRHFPSNVGTLFNLGILYEDMGQYGQAAGCYQRIADSCQVFEDGKYPEYERSMRVIRDKARMFLKDARASSDTHYDDTAVRKRDEIKLLLGVSVSDFELTNRARGVLQQMDIKTLGDLANISEQELMSAKNFGVPSLIEIREMMALKGLSIGMFAKEEILPEKEEEDFKETGDWDEPIDKLDLTVRARKCLSRLNIQTIGELKRKTGDELMKCKNFGITSLNEIRERLAVFGHKLRGE
jgi:DNA-directed RNA polymerase subunit alpha